MIRIGSSVEVSPHSSIAFKNKKGIVVNITEGALLPYMVYIKEVDMRVSFSEDELIELQD
jgi:hypothetical protein